MRKKDIKVGEAYAHQISKYDLTNKVTILEIGHWVEIGGWTVFSLARQNRASGHLAATLRRDGFWKPCVVKSANLRVTWAQYKATR